jgi:hypothetical protein
MKFSLIAICLSGLLCSFANAARPVSYLCVTEMSTGFLGEEKTGKWRVVRFNERKYIVFEPKPGSAELYVRQIGSANPIAQCKVAPEWGGGALHCSGREEFWMDTRNLRFTVTYPHGYWNTAQEMATGGTPFLGIGTCSAL